MSSDELLAAALNMEQVPEDLPLAGEVVNSLADIRILAWVRTISPLVGATNANYAYKQARNVINPVADKVADAYIAAGGLFGTDAEKRHRAHKVLSSGS